MATLDRLVLLNNPDLVTARAQRRVAHAQMLQAGLLPNPSFNGSVGYLLSGVGDATAWTAGISEDIRALVTLAPRRQAARATEQAVDASLLWQEWQTVGKARLLMVDLVEGQRLLDLQQGNVQKLQQQSRQLQQALDEGNVELTATSPYLAAASQAQATLDDLQRRQLSLQHQLAAMLGLAPDAAIPLPTSLDIDTPAAAAIEQAAGSIGRRRPDLVALQLGYQSQEANLRAAVLAQFPALSFGYGASQDNSRVRNAGPTITLDLPLFDRNQQAIAIQQATRQQLHDEYIARFGAAQHDISAMLGELAQLQAQWTDVQSRLPDALKQAQSADAAWSRRLIDSRAYLDLTGAALTQQASAIALEQSMLEQQVALNTLLGTGMPNSLAHDVIDP